ncbi:MAG: hypothetical protein K6E20_02615 [Acholeplasmatales bacterium]|nr:hypothetical protein [Acholeplasmatales bacterium]
MKKIKFVSLIATSILGVAAVASIVKFNKDNNKVETNIDDATKQLVDYNEDGTVAINDKYIDALTDPIYVSPKGGANSAGTKKDPMSFSAACAVARPGTTILLKKGTYSYDYRLQVGGTAVDPNTVHGDETNYITVRPLDLNERVIFDFSEQTFNGDNRGIQLYGNFWHFYGIEVCGAGDNGMYICGSHNIIENCQFYNNRDTGLQIGRGSSSDSTLNSWPSYNLIKNCTSFANYDDITYGENADGFAAKLTVGYGNIFDGCMAFRNSDDGWDLFAKVDSGDIGTVILTNCVSFENGYLPYKNFNKDDTAYYNTYNTLNGDGIGFKLGGSTMKGNVIVDNCATWDNKLHGVSDNSNPGVIQIKNLTAFNNCAGLDITTGKISDTRGIEGITNKSNNIDVARSVESYNSYYGVLSYVNNQAKFTTANDSGYNKDAFRGSTAYSIFNTSYDQGEVYRAFGAYEDASSYSSDLVDTTYSFGTAYSAGITDADFKDLKPINAEVDSVDDIEKLLKIHTKYRNIDGSINMGDHLALASETLNTYCDGNPIGAVLNKSSNAEYGHYGMYTFRNNTTDFTDDQVKVLSAYSVTECITNCDAVYQDFRLPKLIHGASISWTSSDTSVVSIDIDEEVSVSSSVFSWARVNVPDSDKKVKLTATITCGAAVATKEFELTIKGRNQALGDLASTSNEMIRVELYSSFVEPDIYALDDSSITATKLPLSLYDMSYKYEYALDGNSTFYTIDDVYTSVPGVFRVTATATSKADSTVTSSYTYYVYVVDYDCPIDFIGNESNISLSDDGFVVTGDLSNISGSVIATYSTTELTLNTAADIIALGEDKYQEVLIESNSIVAPFVADNNSIVDGSTQYYMYYAVVNTNKSNTDNQVYSSSINVQNVTSKDEFYYLARTGVLPGGSSSSTTIYSLTSDLDFADYSWDVSANTSTGTKIEIDGTEYTVIPEGFKGLFRGNGHTIKNISIKASETVTATDKYVNIFYKLDNGTIMDVNFDNIVLNGDANAKQIGIIGDMVGGYVADVHATRIECTGKESAGGIIAKISGGINNVNRCSFVNPIPSDLTSLESIQNNLEYRISTTNKYEGGIIGNVQLNSDQDLLYLNVYNCYVNAVIGDGKDSGGNAGLLIGRCKGETVDYVLDIEHNVVYGMVVCKGQYMAGIVGDFDNGLAQVTIKFNIADVKFMYNSVYLDAYEAAMNSVEQHYAHKNSSPIVGRAVHAEDGLYITSQNLGSWVEYYKTYIVSSSIAFDYSNYVDDQVFWTMSSSYAFDSLKFDQALWTYDDTTHQLILTVLVK